MHKKEARATVEDIAGLSGLSVDTVRRNQRDGWFDLHDFGSVVKYTHAQMVLRELEPSRERREECEPSDNGK